MICPKCGFRNPKGARFCTKCGESLVPSEALQPEKPLRFQIMRAIMIGAGLFFIFALVVVLGLGGLMFYQVVKPVQGMIAYKTRNLDGTLNFSVIKPDRRGEVLLAAKVGEINYPFLSKPYRPGLRSPFSPDGTKLAFATRKEGKWTLYMADANGGNMVTIASDVDDVDWRFSPDGKKLVAKVSKENSHSLQIIDSITGDAVTLAEQVDDVLFILSPDSLRLAFLVKVRGRWSIYLSNLDGSDRITLAENMEDARCFFSSDGKKILFGVKKEGKWDIYAANSDGSDHSMLASGVDDFLSGSFSPDNKKVALSIGRNGAKWDFYILNTDGSELIALARDVDHAWGLFLPKGNKVLFSVRREGKAGIYIANADGSDIVTIAEGVRNALFSGVSLSANKLILALERDGERELMAVDFKGENRITLVKNAEEIGKVFVIDKKALFGVKEGGKWSLLLVDIMKGDRIMLAKNVEEIRGYDISPDGGKIVFSETNLGVSKLYIINSNGKGKVKLMDGAYDPAWSKKW